MNHEEHEAGKEHEPRMDTDRHGLLFEQETQQIINCAMKVLTF